MHLRQVEAALIFSIAAFVIAFVSLFIETDTYKRIDTMADQTDYILQQNKEIIDASKKIHKALPDSYIYTHRTERTDLSCYTWKEKEVATWIYENQASTAHLTEADALGLVYMVEGVVSEATNLDYIYVLSVMAVESKYDSNAMSASGATGLMQLIPKWFTQMALKYNITDIKEPHENVLLGSAYLDHLYSETQDIRLTTDAYNKGLYAASRNSSYVSQVMSVYEELSERVNYYGPKKTT